MAAPSRGLSEDVNNLAMMARELTAPATSQDTVNSLVDDVCAAVSSTKNTVATLADSLSRRVCTAR